MKILGAILFTLGVSQMSFGQDTRLNCPDGTTQHHEQLNREGETMIFDEPSASARTQGQEESIQSNQQSENQINREGSSSTNFDRSLENEAEVEIEGDDYSYEIEAENEGAELNTMPATNQSVVVAPEITVEQERKESALENIIEAPFKAGFSLVSETAEGVGHIVGAPFKAVGKLFGAGDDDKE